MEKKEVERENKFRKGILIFLLLMAAGVTAATAIPTNYWNRNNATNTTYPQYFNDTIIVNKLQAANFTGAYYSADNAKGFTGTCTIGMILDVRNGLIVGCT